MMMGNETGNESVVVMNPKETTKSLSEVSTKSFSEISESGIPYYKYCRTMTEMGVRKPKRRLEKIVRNVRLKNPE